MSTRGASRRWCPSASTAASICAAPDNGDGRSGSFRFDGGGGGSVAWHLAASSREAGDYDIPGFPESAALRAVEEAEEHQGEADEADHDDHEAEERGHQEQVRGSLHGSAAEVRSGSAGFSVVGERGSIGLAVSSLDSEYGIPGHSHAYGGDDEHEEEGHEDEEHHDDEALHEGDVAAIPVVALDQTRIDVAAGLMDPLPGFESVDLRLGINDYEHVENEAGTVGKAVANKAWEARAELTPRSARRLARHPRRPVRRPRVLRGRRRSPRAARRHVVRRAVLGRRAPSRRSGARGRPALRPGRAHPRARPGPRLQRRQRFPRPHRAASRGLGGHVAGRLLVPALRSGRSSSPTVRTPARAPSRSAIPSSTRSRRAT